MPKVSRGEITQRHRYGVGAGYGRVFGSRYGLHFGSGCGCADIFGRGKFRVPFSFYGYGYGNGSGNVEVLTFKVLDEAKSK